MPPTIAVRTENAVAMLAADWRKAGVEAGDILLVHSKLGRTLRRCAVTPELALQSLLEALGPEGTLLLPLFNFDFCKGAPFDVRSTPSQMGILTEAGRRFPGAVRTGHPVYSFAAIGRRAGDFAGLANKSAYGDDSPFAMLHRADGKIGVLDLPDRHSMTFYHYVEERLQVPYRYYKDFTGDYADASGRASRETFRIYVRDLEAGVETFVDPMEALLWEEGHYRGAKPGEGSGFRTIRASALFDRMAGIIRAGRADGTLCRIADRSAMSAARFLDGEEMYRWASDLFPVCRSITGDGVRRTLAYFKELLPGLAVHETPSGTPAFDWTVPDEWNIRDAFVAGADGVRVIDFREHNLHVVGYSEPVDREMAFEELDRHLYSLPGQPDAVPYVSSYYSRRWGFCLSDRKRQAMRARPNERYRVRIDSTLAPGHLTYGELILPGSTEKEILLSTYVCHPSLANNELSGPCVAAALARWIEGALPRRRHTYRILFLPETIGSILYLSRHAEVMKRRTVAGFVLTCIGDDNAYSYVASRREDSLADRVAKHVLARHAPDYVAYSFLERGSEERQYCSPGVDLPVCSVIRTKYGAYPEYHTSLDDLSYISPQGLQGGAEAVRKCIELLEANRVYRPARPCEPQLGKRGLYPTLSAKDSGKQARTMMNLLAYADGSRDLIGVAEKIGVYAGDLVAIARILHEKGVLLAEEEESVAG
jgi:aminopeptidase-like protein